MNKCKLEVDNIFLKLSFNLPIHVVEDGLCVRCGACLEVCPERLIQPGDCYYPIISAENQKKCNECGACMRACPSNVDFSMLYMEQFGRIPDPIDAIGVYSKIYIGYSTNQHVRQSASSGGLVTGLLLYLLQAGVIEQVLVCGINEKKPLEPKAFLARTKEEIIASAQSKYLVVPQMRLLGKIIRSKVKTAIVGLPCHIHAFRKMQSCHRKQTDNVKLAIGLACNRTLEMNAGSELLKLKKVDPSTVKRFEFRGGNEWPGSMCVILKNGQERVLAHDFKDAFNILKTLYTPKRCLTCIDFSAELADISVMDPWVRDRKGGYLFPQHYSMAFVRTVQAVNLIHDAKKTGHLVLEDLHKKTKITPVQLIERSQFKYSQKLKKQIIPARINRYKRAGKPYPVYKIPFPVPSIMVRFAELYDSLLMTLGNWKMSRKIFMHLFFSKTGMRFIALRNRQKKKQVAQRIKGR